MKPGNSIALIVSLSDNIQIYAEDSQSECSETIFHLPAHTKKKFGCPLKNKNKLGAENPLQEIQLVKSVISNARKAKRGL